MCIAQANLKISMVFPVNLESVLKSNLKKTTYNFLFKKQFLFCERSFNTDLKDSKALFKISQKVKINSKLRAWFCTTLHYILASKIAENLKSFKLNKFHCWSKNSKCQANFTQFNKMSKL